MANQKLRDLDQTTIVNWDLYVPVDDPQLTRLRKVTFNDLVRQPVLFPVLSSTVIAVGDLLWFDADPFTFGTNDGTVKPASMFPWDTDLPTTQAWFAGQFIGIAMQASNNGESDPIFVDVSPLSLHQFDVVSGTYRYGDNFGPDEDPVGVLSNTMLEAVVNAGLAIARIMENAGPITTGKFAFAGSRHTASANSNAAIG